MKRFRFSLLSLLVGVVLAGGVFFCAKLAHHNAIGM